MDGRVFDSKKEAARYQELSMLERSGIIKSLVCQPKFPLDVNGTRICTYIADFSYVDQSGREVIEDVKGIKTATYRLKAKLMIACYGLRVVEV